MQIYEESKPLQLNKLADLLDGTDERHRCLISVRWGHFYWIFYSSLHVSLCIYWNAWGGRDWKYYFQKYFIVSLCIHLTKMVIVCSRKNCSLSDCLPCNSVTGVCTEIRQEMCSFGVTSPWSCTFRWVRETVLYTVHALLLKKKIEQTQTNVCPVPL